MCGYYSKTSITDIWETLSPGGFLLWRVNEDKPPPPRTAPREPRAAPEPQPQAKPPSGERRGPRLTAPATDEPGPPSEPQGRRPPEAPPRLGAPQVSPSQQDPACRLPRLSPPEARGPLSARPPTPHPATQATRALRPRALHATCELGPGGPGLEQGRGDSAPPARPPAQPKRPAGPPGSPGGGPAPSGWRPWTSGPACVSGQVQALGCSHLRVKACRSSPSTHSLPGPTRPFSVTSRGSFVIDGKRPIAGGWGSAGPSPPAQTRSGPSLYSVACLKAAAGSSVMKPP